MLSRERRARRRPHASHPRAREAIRLLVDRLLPDGGCNYGNTSVLGQFLRPHIEPTGLVLTALAGEPDQTGRIQRSLEFVASNVGPDTTAASLAYALIGLAAHDRWPKQADAWLADAATRTERWPGGLARRALLTLAASGTACPWITLTRKANRT